MKNEDVKNRIVMVAEAIRAEAIYDIAVDIDLGKFTVLAIREELWERKKLHNSIYKYYN